KAKRIAYTASARCGRHPSPFARPVSHGSPESEPSATPPSPRPVRGRGIGVRLGLSLVLAVAFALALRPYLRAVPPNLSIPGWVIPAYLATLVPYHLLRAGRWQFLLQPLDPPRWRTTLAIGLA